MAYSYDKSTGDIVINGWEKGIAVSPLKGIANMQAVNISTEIGEVMCNFSRTQQSQSSTTGTFTVTGSSTVGVSGNTAPIKTGSWITMTSTGITGLTNDTSYYVLDASSQSGILLSTTYSNNFSDAISGYTGSTATFTTINMNIPITSATEIYTASEVGNGSISTQQYRYYILDNNGLVWVSDSSSLSVNLVQKPDWFLPDKTVYAGTTGMNVINGFLFIFQNDKIYAKPTVKLGSGYTSFSGGSTMSINNTNPHFSFVTKSTGTLFYTDGRFIGSIYPNSSLLSGLTNIQSFASYTTSTTTGTIATLISGSLPYTGTAGSTSRVPAIFFASTGGTVASLLSEGSLYWILYNSPTVRQFQVYDAITAGNLLDITTGATGTQYFNTFYPISGDGIGVMNFSPQALTLPNGEKSQAISELGLNLIIGCASNAIYPWNQKDITAQDFISLPENNVSSIINVNNMGYIFAGRKGNIYITNGSSVSPVISVPDYCAGIPGTPKSYIEPYFIWGGTMYLRGRVYFSIQDQNSSKTTGNCGGIWSFIPTQNEFIGQDTGISLRLENQASYGTYNGYSTVLLSSQNQQAISPQYWNGWQSTSSGTTFGIDFTNTTTSTVANIETDLIPVGTMLDKRTFKQIEYKLSTPLAVGESVAISYRTNSTDYYKSCGTVVAESTTSLSGYFTVNFEKSQWLQLQIVLTPLSTSSSTFVRLSEIRVR